MTDNLYSNFDEYLQEEELCVAEKARTWKAAIGLQQVDGLTPSEYLIQTAKQNIEGSISIEDVKKRIDSYYEQLPAKNKKNREEEADKVSTRIAEILNEQSFVLSPVEYLSIHRRLFENIYPHAGKIRKYNIRKKEWVLDGESVLYGSAHSLKETLEYDFAQERKFSYQGLTQSQVIEHIANFISYLWQIHVFGEGNTRTTAVFLIKYLRKLGFEDTNNDLFEKHSWYFRNSLVRANYENISKNIHPTRKYLIRFLDNLLLGKNYSLKNRELHIYYNDIIKLNNYTANLKNDTVNPKNDTVKLKTDTANQKADTLNDSLNLNNDTVNPKNDTVKLKTDTLKPENDTVKLKTDTLNPKVDTVKLETDSLNHKIDTVKLETDTLNPTNDTVKLKNDTLKPKNDTANQKADTLNDTVFNEIQKNNKITADEIAKNLNISLSTVRRRIKVLKDSQKIKRIGSDKTGHWKVL